MIKVFKKVLESMLNRFLHSEEASLRAEWYRNEITQAFEDNDFERALFLERESTLTH